MTDTEAALLRACAAHPDEDVPRLAYADCLDERGEPAASARAEFVRVQVRAARLAHNDPDAEVLARRADELHHAWCDAGWPDAPAGVHTTGNYRRGFATRAWGLTSAVFAADDDPRALFYTQLELSIDVPPSRLREAVRLPLFARLLELTVRGGSPLGWGGAKALAEGEYPNLERLGLAGQALGDIGLRYLCNSWGLMRLRELDLSNNDITDDGAAALLRSGLLPRLRTLRLWGNALGPATLERLRANGRVW
ncbi:MAG: TIGR02996 domain-containing protein [Planctomycetes bacterium]|nr:TIGR02996 domain-containing protein [Planctomycetota bacterium]